MDIEIIHDESNKWFKVENMVTDGDVSEGIDVVCVYNDKKTFMNEIYTSLKNQKSSSSIRLIAIDNQESIFSSMAQAYNFITPYLVSKYVLFLHQDIVFNNDYVLEDLLKQINTLNENSIWGMGGAKYPSRINCYTRQAPVEVDTVDECFFGMKRFLVECLKFNEEVCDNWHMYAVEMCIHNRTLQGCNYVLNVDITHTSPGYVSYEYIKTLNKVIHYYKKYIDYVWTTCAKVELRRCYHFYMILYLIKHEVLNKIIRPFKNIFISKK